MSEASLPSALGSVLPKRSLQKSHAIRVTGALCDRVDEAREHVDEPCLEPNCWAGWRLQAPGGAACTP